MLDLVWTTFPHEFKAYYVETSGAWVPMNPPSAEKFEFKPVGPVDPEVGWTTTLDGGW